MLQLITSSQYAFDDFYPTTTIGYLPGRTINLFSTDEADYMRDTFISLENIKKIYLNILIFLGKVQD